MHTTDTLHEMRRLLESGTGTRKSLLELKKLPDRISTVEKENTDSKKPTAPKVDVYEGTLQENKRNGKGTMNYVNGDVYVGFWLEDKRNGSGKMTYINGNVYEGNWEDDKMKGVGKFIHRSPDPKEVFDWKFCGEFDNDFPVSGTLTYKENSTCNQTYADKWTTVDIKEQMPSSTSKTMQKKSGVDPKSDSLSDLNPQKTEMRNSEKYDRQEERNDRKKNQQQSKHNTSTVI